MAPVLLGRPGDVQFLKGVLAAKVSDTEVQIQLLSAADPKAPSVELRLEQGVSLTDPNAVCRLLGPPVSGSQQLGVEEWLDFEETLLRPTISAGQSIQQAQQLLSDTLASQPYLTGDQPSIADLSIFGTLLRVPEGELLENVQSFQSRVHSIPEVQQGIEAAQFSRTAPASGAGQRAQLSQHTKSKRPIPGERNILITSALPYVNNVPHLGNIIGCVLSADCYARYCRARQRNTLFVCGTDEYGTATEAKALEEGLTCQAVCDKYFAAHRGIYEWFGISFDHFGRTPTWQQTEIAQDIFRTLQQQGQLTEQTIEQLYSEAAGKFLADRFVSGTCPNADCQFEDARGDQCDKCGRLLNPTELLNPKCKLTGTTPVLRSTRHFFLDLPALTPQLQDYIDRTSRLGGWSANCVKVTNAWMRDGLKPRCITRDLKWGTPVPLEGYEDKVFYVWFDAPIGYISITANHTQHWQEWWKNPDDVELVQFMGKDNVPFHTVIFPSTLLGTGESWTLMKNISVTEYLNYEGTKFSKRAGTGVFGDDTQKTGIPVEVWRYYLLANRPENSDADFKWSDLAAKNNAELKNNLGNFINRTLKFVTKADTGLSSSMPQVYESKGSEKVAALGQEVADLVQRYIECMDRIKLREAIKIAMTISAAGNKFFQDHQIFKLVKTDIEECSTLLAACVGLVLLLAALIAPFMPSLTEKVLGYMNLPSEAAYLTDELLSKAGRPHTLLPAGHHINEPAPLIAEISAAREAELRDTYRGSQADRASAGTSAGPSDAASAKASKAKKDKSKKPASNSSAPDSSASTSASNGSQLPNGKPAASTDGQAAGKKQKSSGRKGTDKASKQPAAASSADPIQEQAVVPVKLSPEAVAAGATQNKSAPLESHNGGTGI